MSGIQAIAQLMSGQIFSSLVIGFLLASFVALLLLVFARQNSRARFAIRFAALLAIAAAFLWKHSGAYSAAAVHARAPELLIPATWALYIFGAWALASSIGLVQVVHGLWRVRQLRRSCDGVDEKLAAVFADLVAGARRSVSILVSDRVNVPAAIGFFRPAIVLPRWTLDEQSPGELRSVVLHELAHLERWDDWTNLAQKVIRALLFFHPAVWWMDGRLTIEREMSCDDIVLARSSNPHGYAACLVSLAEKASARKSMVLAQAAVAKLHHTAQRIARILDGRQRKLTPVVIPSAAALVTFIIVGFITSTHTSHLVAFENAAPEHNSRSSASMDPGSVMPVLAVPAAFHPRLPEVKTAPKRDSTQTHKVAKPRPQMDTSKPVLARRERNVGPHPVVVNASMHDKSPRQFMYVVVRTTEYDGWGQITVTTTVWRFPAGHSAPVRVQSETPPRAT